MKNTILVVLSLVAVMVTMVVGGTKVEASTPKETPLKTAQNTARALYGVTAAIEKGKGEARAEKHFMFNFGEQNTIAGKIKNKKMKKAVKKMDDVVMLSRFDYNAGNKEEALKRITEWVEKDYEKTLDTLYKK
nr:MAG TPA: hypothetical protein [Caudoviricetes sp.]